MSAVQKREDFMLLSNNQNGDLFQILKDFQQDELHFKNDSATGLQAIIAIHNTRLGPALGGCRFIEYPNTNAALRDALRLSQAMSYKAALAGLPLGGGKSVILRPAHMTNREALFESFGKFVEELGGRYITAMDSGSTEEDMNVIFRKTRHVSGHSLPGGISGNPAPYTAHGVCLGIQSAVKFKFKRSDLAGIHVAIQGVGQVGYLIAKELHASGVKLTVADVNPIAVKRCVEEFNATAVSNDTILQTECDVLAPCALGGVLDENVIAQLNTPIVAGAANNVLQKPENGLTLHQKDILYAPDYVINSGGLIQACSLYFGKSEEEIRQKIQFIGARLTEIFTRSQQENKPTSIIAETMAKEIIHL